MKFVIPADDSEHMVNLLTVMRHEFPALSRQLKNVVKKARKGISIEVKPVESSHTREQENYYWKWCREFGAFCGTTPDETHEEMLCRAYGSGYIQTRFGLKRRALMRSSQTSTMEYSTLIETLIRTAAEMDFVIPPPIRRLND